MKDQIVFAISTAESRGLTRSKKVDHIASKFETVYGGFWSGFFYNLGPFSVEHHAKNM